MRALVLAGTGGDFSVGADLAAERETRVLRGRSVKDDHQRLTDATRSVELLRTFPRPTLAVIDGACPGAGLSLALAADLRITTERSVFNTAFVNAGLSDDLGSAWLLTRTVGPAAARSLLLVPRRIGGAEAVRCGLASELAVDIDARIEQLRITFAAQAPLAASGAKQNLVAAERPFMEYLADEVRQMVACAHSEDATEATAAFLTKRAPRFHGR